jgi:hypothetical protein
MMRKLTLACILACFGTLSAGACNNGDDACRMAKDSLKTKCTDEAGVITEIDPGSCNPDDDVQRCAARCVALVATCGDLATLAASMQETRTWLDQKACSSPPVDAGAACPPPPPPPDGGPGGAGGTAAGGAGGSAAGAGGLSAGGTSGAAAGGAGGAGGATAGGAGGVGGVSAGGAGGLSGGAGTTGGTSGTTGGTGNIPDASVPSDAGADASPPRPGVCPASADTATSIGPLYSERDVARSALGGPAPPPEGGTEEDSGSYCAACSDDQRNGDESDRDCGGSCKPCLTSRACRVNTDCATTVCMAGKCTAHPPAANVSTQFRTCLANCLLY